MKSAYLSTMAALLILFTTTSAWGETYRFYHTMDDVGAFRVRVKNVDTGRFYTTAWLSFLGRPAVLDLPDGTYELSRTLRGTWKSLGKYQFGDEEFADPSKRVYVGTNDSFWSINEDGEWERGMGAPPVQMEIARGLLRIPYFGIRGSSYQDPPGVLVTWVEQGSAATKLQRNNRTYYLEANVDVITEVNGQPVHDFATLKKMIVDSQGMMDFKAYDLRKRATLEYEANF